MRLIVHPGFGKTATTWLQTSALPKSGVWLLGKGSAGDGSEDRWNHAVQDLHYRVFSPVYGPDTMWRRFRDCGPLLREYAEAIASELNEALAGERPESARRQPMCDLGVAVLSDENIFAYGGVEANVGLLSYFCTAVRERIHEPVELEVVLTVREQSSFLQSYFAFNFFHLRRHHRDFRAFLAEGAAQPSAGVFGMLFYDDAAEMLSSVLPSDARVRVATYETLTADGPDAFLEMFLGTAPVAVAAPTAPQTGDAPVNTHHGSYQLRDVPSRYRVMPWARSAANARRSTRLGQIILAGLDSRALRRLSPTSPVRLRKERAELSPEQARTIRAIYAESNRRLDARFDLNLARLGYAV